MAERTQKEQLVDELCGYLEETLESIRDSATVMANGVGVSYQAEIDAINALIQPVAMTIMSLLFIIDLIDLMTRKGDELRWEDVARSLIKFLICKNLMVLGPTILEVIYTTVNGMILAQAGNVPLDNVLNALKLVFEGKIPDDKTGMKQLFNALGQYIIYIGFYVDLLITRFIAIIISVMCYARSFEISVLQALSAIPIAFAGWGETKDVPKRFIMGYLGVNLQGLVIIICFKIFVAMSAGVTSVSRFLFCTALLLLGIASSGKWAKDSLGLM